MATHRPSSRRLRSGATPGQDRAARTADARRARSVLARVRAAARAAARTGRIRPGSYGMPIFVS